MSLKESATIDVGYPILGAKFINNKTVLVTGGGGEGNNGIPNKITAIKCSFKVNDANRRLQKFREITLPSNEDSPQCLDIAKISDDEEYKYSIFVGCNQSSSLIKTMNINNNLRKYVFTQEEHIRFLDAAQLEAEIGEESDEYPKIIRLSPNNTTGCLMTSAFPSAIYIFNPDSLDLNFKFKPKEEVEIKDFHMSPDDDGKTLCYTTASAIETISTITGNPISSTTKSPTLCKELKNYNLSKVRFIDNSNVIIAASLRNRKSVAIFQYSIPDQKIIKQKVISKKFNAIVALDISVGQNLIAIAGNDLSVTLLKLSDFRTIKFFKKLHPFAITSVAFSPNGSKLATASAANILHVLKIPQDYGRGRSTIGTLIQYLFTIMIIGLIGILLQKGHENGQLEEYYGLSKHYGKISIELAKEYGQITYQLLKEKLSGENIEGDDTTKKYFKVDVWDDNSSIERFDHASDTYITNFSTETLSTSIEAETEFSDPVSIGTSTIKKIIKDSSAEVSDHIPTEDLTLKNDHIKIQQVTKSIEHETKDKEEIDTKSILSGSNAYTEETNIADTVKLKQSTTLNSVKSIKRSSTLKGDGQKTRSKTTDRNEPIISSSIKKSTSITAPIVTNVEEVNMVDRDDKNNQSVSDGNKKNSKGFEYSKPFETQPSTTIDAPVTTDVQESDDENTENIINDDEIDGDDSESEYEESGHTQDVKDTQRIIQESQEKTGHVQSKSPEISKDSKESIDYEKKHEKHQVRAETNKEEEDDDDDDDSEQEEEQDDDDEPESEQEEEEKRDYQPEDGPDGESDIQEVEPQAESINEDKFNQIEIEKPSENINESNIEETPVVEPEAQSSIKGKPKITGSLMNENSSESFVTAEDKITDKEHVVENNQVVTETCQTSESEGVVQTSNDFDLGEDHQIPDPIFVESEATVSTVSSSSETSINGTSESLSTSLLSEESVHTSSEEIPFAGEASSLTTDTYDGYSSSESISNSASPVAQSQSPSDTITSEITNETTHSMFPTSIIEAETTAVKPTGRKKKLKKARSKQTKSKKANAPNHDEL